MSKCSSTRKFAIIFTLVGDRGISVSFCRHDSVIGCLGEEVEDLEELREWWGFRLGLRGG